MKPLSTKTLRTLALYTQQLAVDNTGSKSPDEEAILNLINKIGALQIDTLSVVSRSHYLTLWSRIGQYSMEVLDTLVYNEKKRKLFEYWFHGASIIPLKYYRYSLTKKRTYRENGDKWNSAWLQKPENIELMKSVLKKINENGSLSSADLQGDGISRGSWWDWKPAKSALQQLYNRGDIMVSNRKSFKKIYQITDKVLPKTVNTKEASWDEMMTFKCELSLKALGICKPQQIADYTHTKRSEIKKYIEKLIKQGHFLKVQGEFIDGSIHDLLIHRSNLKILKKITDGELSANKTTLLNPFDNLFWPRDRDKEIWGFEQVLEAYKPEEKRKWGYYCLAILYHDQLIGRIEPKLDRSSNTMIIKSVFLEDGVKITDKMLNSVSDCIKRFSSFHNAKTIRFESNGTKKFIAALRPYF
ncbi:MAG: YcaQ family DNA glycosylase [Bacteroidetes bacterium]|nr:YcaQ family DNA glycosylase [Bacteroidota bacterium]